MKIIKTLNRSILPLALISGLSACGSDSDPKVDIRYTEFGVPHIKADNYYGVSYGQGYTHAQDNMCTLAEQVIAVRSEKAKVMGAGDGDASINQDFGVLALGVYQQAQDTFAELDATHKAVLNGYVDGFNFAVNEKGDASNYPSPCRDADWIPEVSAVDLHAYHLRLALLASGDAVNNQVATAQPPAAAPAMVSAASAQSKTISDMVAPIIAANNNIGSNGWALGREKTESGNSMLLSNPHFPWQGHLRFIQSHITIPGKLNVTGVGFVGVPGILIGFNDNMAWTHTVSQSKRLTVYQLTLNPADPTQYAYGTGDNIEYRDMSSRDFTIEVKDDAGNVSEVTRTLYSSHYGPVMGWLNSSTALSFRDANANNTNLVPQWLAMNKAKSLYQFQKAYSDHQGIPWVNTMATDTSGNVFYIDGARTANLNPEAEAQIKPLLTTPLSTLQAAQDAGMVPAGTVAIATQLQAEWKEGQGQLVLDGSNPAFEWVNDERTKVPGTVPVEKAPKATRGDYVFNANSSHWLTHVQQPLEGYSIVYGPEKTIRSPRTRMNAKQLTEASANGASGADGKFSFEELKGVMTNQRGLLAELVKDSVTARCSGKTNIDTGTETVDISGACNAISNWDGRYYTTSIGAHVFREFLKQFQFDGERNLEADFFAQPFTALDPVNTPNTLAPRADSISDDDDPVLQALAQTTLTLNELNFDLTSELGQLQFHAKNNIDYAIPGGQNIEGVFNINRGSATQDVGYPVVHGASWVMALEYTDNGPKAEAWLTYSQSHDPESDNYDDQTELFSKGQWRPVRFTEQDINNNLVSRKTLSLP